MTSAGPPGPQHGGPPPAAPAVCVRHPDRPTGLTCTRCGRPACPDCLREASVGYQCVDCVAEGQRGARRGRTVAGAAPGRRPVVVVPTLIAVNVALFLWTVLQAGSVTANANAPVFGALSLVPRLVGAGEWWRVVTAGFLHIGPVHLVFNMLALYVLGRDLESVLGRGRFLAVYFIAMLGGSAAVMVFDLPRIEVAGASGAVFGLMGGLAVVLRRMRFPLGQVVGLIVVNIVISFVIPGISITGHLGGLVVGAAATAALVYGPGRHRTSMQAVLLGALTVLVLALMWVTTLT
ncbi:rhomboid family intramembrane serine protease [Pseudonocardia lacus]|uniref:rhomboid family intramembrane serine protease n=1 Tax=Pseudonocardia lacus TaxID=2835865 RepID=UPI001BDCDD38|nr:rhomboid family intramembrane serine protease [Pseudonocardia lacus]